MHAGLRPSMHENTEAGHRHHLRQIYVMGTLT